MKIINSYDIQTFSSRKSGITQNVGNSFSDFIDSAANVEQDKTVISELKTNYEEILSEAKNVIKEIYGDQLDENSNVIDLSDEDVNEFLSMLQTNINELFNQTSNLYELLNSINEFPVGISALMLIAKVDGLNKMNEKFEIDQLMAKLNSLLELEFESYKTPHEFSLQNMFLALDNMKLEDKALLEGQIIIISASDQVLDEIRYYNKFLSLARNLSETSLGRDILINNLLDDSTENLRKLLLSEDSTEINNLLTKLVNNDNLMEYNGQSNNLNKEMITSQPNSTFILNYSNLSEESYPIHLDRFIKHDQPINLGEKITTYTATREELTTKMTEFLKSSRYTQFNNGTSRLVIKLTPEHLGSITIKIVQQKNGEMIAKIIASCRSAKELLEHSGTQLKQALPNINIEFQKFDVFTDDSSRFLRENKDSKQDQEPKNQQSNSQNDDENEVRFKESLDEALNISI